MQQTNNATTVLISGVSGFIGSHLAKRLRDLGYIVHGIVKNEVSSYKGIGSNSSYYHSYHGNTSELVEIVQSIKPEICFHLASYFKSEHEINDVQLLIESNLLFGTQLIEAFSTSPLKKKKPLFINAGTIWQNAYGRAYYPVSLYAAAKQAFQDLLSYYSLHREVEIVALKLSDTYGPNDPRNKIIPQLIAGLHSEVPLKLSGGEQYIDPIFVDDVVEAFIRVSKLVSIENQSETIFPLYTVCSGNPIRLKDLVSLVEKISKKKLPVEWGARPYRKVEMFEPWNVGEPVPGWAPKVSLAEGLKILLESSQELKRESV
jgi:nucleoside-diphosphate-sugar epimerase